MLGELRATYEETSVSRFRTRRVGLLLAYLAFYRERPHTRQEVGEMLWPEGEPEVMARNLRQALTSLRHVLEPPPLPANSVLQVQRTSLRLNPDAVATDVEAFEAALVEARRTESPVEKERLLRQALSLYRGELLPGFDEDWIVHERLRLEDLHVSALQRLAEISRESGDLDEAIHAWRLAVAKEPFQEEGHLALMRLYLDAGRPASAIQQFLDLREQLRQGLGEVPCQEAIRLWEEARRAEPEALPPSLATEKVIARPEPTVRLPLLLNRLRGREEEMGAAFDAFTGRDARLVTLLGPAGTGKTRLSVEVGRRLAAEGWSVTFVPLADLADASMIPEAILDTLRVRRTPGQDATDALRESVREPGRRLLILDNLEHLLEASIPTVERIVAEVPDLRLLVTSRQVLRLEAEHRIPLQPLPFPIPESSIDLAGWIESPSVQLFIDRCQMVRPDFQLTACNARAVLEICAKLEGIPLAIELAAALSGSFTPAQMATHLESRRMTLSSRRRDLPDRHRSLHAAIEYSYATLLPEMQRLFAALSVFRGGFTVEAATEVGGLSSREICLDRLLELQERSLLQPDSEEEGGEPRFRMLETFREYGGEKLSPEDETIVRAAHARFFRTLFVPPSGNPTASERIRHHHRIEADYDNGIAALEFLGGEGDLEACVELLSLLSFTWSSRGPRTIEQRFIRSVAERAESQPMDPVARIGLLRMLGTTHLRELDYAAAYAVCQRALIVAESNDLGEQVAVCYSAISTCAGYLGNLDECLDLSRRVFERASPDNYPLRERAYLGIGAVHWGRGELKEAETAYLDAIACSVRWRGGEPDSHLLRNLARVCMDEGRFDEAMVKLGEAMRIARRLQDESGLGMGLSLISRYHWLRGNLPAAVSSGHESLLRLQAAEFAYWSLLGLHQQALVMASLEEWETAATLLGATGEIGKSSRIIDERDREAALTKIRSHLPTVAFERSWARGLAMDLDEAFRVAFEADARIC
ncbi:BTAD domain-containing putative transcriptional regulator [soil metagenome]